MARKSWRQYGFPPRSWKPAGTALRRAPPGGCGGGSGARPGAAQGKPGGVWDNGTTSAMGAGVPGLGQDPHTCPLDLPSSPNTFPQWAQKKCSGCQVWSRAVRTFCRKRCGEVAAAAGAGVGGRGLYLADGAGAVGAERGEGSVIVLLAVRPPAALEEGPAAQLLPAAGAGEVLGVPGCAQGRENLRGQGSREPGHRQGGAGARPGLTLPATGLRQAAQTPAGAAEMPSSCRSWVRLPSILSSEGSGSAAPPAPCPAVASCGKEDGEDGVRTRTRLPPGRGSPGSACVPGRPGARPAAGRLPWVGARGAAAAGPAQGC